MVGMLLLLAVSLGAFSSPTPPPITFLLAGQSNMSGRGGTIQVPGASHRVFVPSSALELALVQPDGLVERLNVSLGWEPAVEPLHFDVDSNHVNDCGIGSGLLFARFLAVPCRLIPCAVGGTSLDEWAPSGELYRRMLGRAAHSQIDALLWFQGEEDANAKESALRYEDKLVAWIVQLRKDLK
jgi:hypothetical protein